ncbi:uncharacterized protein LOC134814504 isoform X2 [Bolinopsis microptera]|uniref:uncharacterized protein LOC134814504 isoform X2 n=1 Tax=Bolinopsis microptera TaxID=2820187 RepID=UPI0030798C48
MFCTSFFKSIFKGCDLSSNTGIGIMDYSSMEWLNSIISSWYYVNNDQVHELVKTVLEKELNNLTPDIIEKISLEECTFGSDTPQIKGIKTRVVEMPCLKAGKQQKVVIDLILSIDAPDFEFRLAVKVPMLTLRAAVQKLSFMGNLRITVLFSDQVSFPGIQNLCITFTDRPELGFNVELLDAIDIDAFGIDKLISDVIEDVLSKQLVYPGRLYVDVSKVGARGGVDVVMMPRMSDQHPGVVTTKVQVSRITRTTETTDIEISAKLGNEEEKKSIELMIDDQIMNHNFLISDFDAQDLLVKAWESRLIFKDIQYGSVKVDLADMEFTLPSVTETFSNEDKNVKVTVEVKAYLLPLIALVQKGVQVEDYQTKFNVGCSAPPDLNTGVLYVHIHRAAGIPKTDDNSKADPFVTVYYNGKEIFKTKEVSNSDSPIFNEWTELLTESFVGSELTYKLDDNDVWPNSNDPIGATSMKLTKEDVRKVNTALKLDTQRKDATEDILLYVSVVFRPVPLV